MLTKTTKRKLCLSGLATEAIPQCIIEDKRLSPEAFMLLVRSLALFNYNWVTKGVTYNEGILLTDKDYREFSGLSEEAYKKADAELFKLGYCTGEKDGWWYWAYELYYGK